VDLEISDVIGSFDLARFWIAAHQVSGAVTDTGWIIGGPIDVIPAIPEPGTLGMLMLLFGVTAMIFWHVRNQSLPQPFIA
jgi:PEP-CTERM motif